MLEATRPHLGATRSHLGATRPRVGIVKLGLDAPTWQCNDEREAFCICLPRHRALSSKCRRGDASPPGEDATPSDEEAPPSETTIQHFARDSSS